MDTLTDAHTSAVAHTARAAAVLASTVSQGAEAASDRPTAGRDPRQRRACAADHILAAGGRPQKRVPAGRTASHGWPETAPGVLPQRSHEAGAARRAAEGAD